MYYIPSLIDLLSLVKVKCNDLITVVFCIFLLQQGRSSMVKARLVQIGKSHWRHIHTSLSKPFEVCIVFDIHLYLRLVVACDRTYHIYDTHCRLYSFCTYIDCLHIGIL